jgi:8-oxo-dGTP diphosphatase
VGDHEHAPSLARSAYRTNTYGRPVSDDGAEAWAERFPDLFRERFEEYANADLTFRLGTSDDALVGRLHLVAVNPDGLVVVCRSVEGWRFLPGGTREPGETLTELAARELLEEAGCRLLGAVEVFAHQRSRSRNPEPFRPHLPHPDAAWAYATARVERSGDPTNPPDGESVVEVLALSVADAATWLRVHDAEHADVLLLSDALGLISPAG